MHPAAPGVMLTKRQQIDWVRAHPQPPACDKHFEALTVRVYGDTAIANSVVSVTDAAGAPHRTLLTDVFIFTHRCLHPFGAAAGRS